MCCLVKKGASDGNWRAFDRLVADEVLLDDLRDVLGGQSLVVDVVRVELDHRASGAGTEAAGAHHPDVGELPLA